MTQLPSAADETAATERARAEELHEVELWFVDRGVPHFIERKTDGSMLDAWTRSVPLLVVGYVLMGINALDLRQWSLLRNLLVAAVVIFVLVAAWVLSNRLRGVPAFARPTDIDAPELAVFLLAPAAVILVFDQVDDAIESLAFGLVLLAVTYAWASYGVGPLSRWAWRRGRGQLVGLGSLVARALPLLLLFNTFLFINAEVWEIAGTLHGLPYPFVIATFVLLGATFAFTRVPNIVRSLNSFSSWSDIADHLADTPASNISLPTGALQPDRLSVRQRLNIGLVVLFGQALQITLVALTLTGFFIMFGFFAISESAAMNWTRLDDVNVLAHASVSGRSLVVSEPLLRVSFFLGAFSGMYFTVVLTTDDTYRNEFTDDIAPQIREALAVRSAYRVARGTHPQANDVAQHQHDQQHDQQQHHDHEHDGDRSEHT